MQQAWQIIKVASGFEGEDGSLGENDGLEAVHCTCQHQSTPTPSPHAAPHPHHRP